MKLFWILLFFCLTSYGKTVVLTCNDKKMSVDQVRAIEYKQKGTLLIVNDINRPATEIKLLKPLQDLLKLRNWSTLTVTGKVAAKELTADLECSLAHLVKEGEKRIAILAIGKSYQPTMKFLLDEKPRVIQGFILLNPLSLLPPKEMDALSASWHNLPPSPLCLIYSQHGYEKQLKVIQRLIAILSNRDHTTFRVMPIKAGKVGSIIFTQTMIQHIASWLHATTKTL